MAQLQEFPKCETFVAELDWRCGPVGHSRDSDDIEECNFDVVIEAMQAMDPDAQDHEAVCFSHWACGWVEEIFTRPGSACEAYAEEVRKQLLDYPVLDEMRLEQYEADAEVAEVGGEG